MGGGRGKVTLLHNLEKMIKIKDLQSNSFLNQIKYLEQDVIITQSVTITKSQSPRGHDPRGLNSSVCCRFQIL